MKKLLSSALIASAAILPCIVHAQWQITYQTTAPWYKDFPFFVNNAWIEKGITGTISGNTGGGLIQEGSSNYPVRKSQYFQECEINGTTTVTIGWIGDPAEVPHYVDLRVTVSTDGFFDEAYAGTGWFNANLHNVNIWTNGDGTESGNAYTTSTTDYVFDWWDGGPLYDLVTVTEPQLISHAHLLYQNPPDPYGDLGIDCGVSYSVTGEAIPYP